MEKEMKPPVDEAPTKEELEVARILRNFPKLVLEAESRRLPDFLRWGVRRRRSALDDEGSLHDPSPPLPPPSISPSPDGKDVRKDGDRGDAGGGATLSPATPFSFPASGSEELDCRPPRPPCSNPAKKFKKTNRHVEWVKEQKQLIASLSEQKVHLQRSIQEFETLYHKLKVKNSSLRDLQSKAVREFMAKEGQAQRQRQDGSFGLPLLGPTTLQSPTTRSLVDPHNQRWEIQQRLPPPPPVDRIAGGGTSSPSVVAAGQWPEKKAALDLNASPEEEEEEEEWKRSSAYKAAQARKRRLEIQREKNNNCASPSPHPLLSMAHKMPRLR